MIIIETSTALLALATGSSRITGNSELICQT